MDIPHHFLWLCPNKLEVKEATSSINLHLFLPLTGVYVLYKIYGFLLLQNISFFLPKRGENRKMFSVFNFSPSQIFFLFFPRRRGINKMFSGIFIFFACTLYLVEMEISIATLKSIGQF